MRERSPRQNSPAEINALFREARQTVRISTQLTGRFPLPPKSEIESFIKHDDSPFIHALLGAYPVPEVGDIQLRIGEPTVAQLCQSAEQRLVNAVKSGAVRLGIDPQTKEPKFILKYIGKLVALCIDDFSLANGQVARKDHWYMPVDSRTTMKLEHDFRSQGTAQFELSQGAWALMRPLELENLRTIASVWEDDPTVEFRSLMESDLFEKLLRRVKIPEQLIDIDGLILSPENFRKRKTNFESIYDDIDLISAAHADVIASD